MSGGIGARAARPARAPGTGIVPEPWIGAGAVVAAGCGSALAAGGWAAGVESLAVVGGAFLLTGLGVLLVTRWVAGLPLLVFALVLPAPYATESFRLSAALVATGVLLAAWCLRRGVDGDVVRLGSLPRRSSAALLGAVALSAAFAEALLPAARELVTFLLLLGLLVAATDELSLDRRLPGRLARLLALVAGAAGPLAFLEALGVLPGRFPLPGTGFHRATLGFGWPNELAMFFALSVPLAVYGLATARGPLRRTVAAVALAGVVLGLGATFSRGSWLAVPAGAAALLLAGHVRLTVRIWGAALVGALALDLATGGAVTGRLGSLPTDWVVEQRAALVVTGLLMFRAHPVVGVGPGGFAEQLERFGPQVSWLWDYVGSAHNSYVHMAAETGVIGLAAFVSFLGAAILVHFRGARRARGAGAEPGDAGQPGDADQPEDADSTPDEAALRLALLWCMGIVLVLGGLEWVLAHGIGQLVVLVAAMGFALDARRSDDPSGEGP